MKILEDALAIEDAGCFMLEFEAVPAKIATAPSNRRRCRQMESVTWPWASAYSMTGSLNKPTMTASAINATESPA